MSDIEKVVTVNRKARHDYEIVFIPEGSVSERVQFVRIALSSRDFGTD